MKRERERKHKDVAELCVESSEPSSVPRVRLEAIIRCIAKAVGSSSENFIDNEGTLSFGLELVLLLLWWA